MSLSATQPSQKTPRTRGVSAMVWISHSPHALHNPGPSVVVPLHICSSLICTLQHAHVFCLISISRVRRRVSQRRTCVTSSTASLTPSPTPRPGRSGVMMFLVVFSAMAHACLSRRSIPKCSRSSICLHATSRRKLKARSCEHCFTPAFLIPLIYTAT